MTITADLSQVPTQTATTVHIVLEHSRLNDVSGDLSVDPSRPLAVITTFTLQRRAGPPLLEQAGVPGRNGETEDVFSSSDVTCSDSLSYPPLGHSCLYHTP